MNLRQLREYIEEQMKNTVIGIGYFMLDEIEIPEEAPGSEKIFRCEQVVASIKNNPLLQKLYILMSDYKREMDKAMKMSDLCGGTALGKQMVRNKKNKFYTAKKVFWNCVCHDLEIDNSQKDLEIRSGWEIVRKQPNDDCTNCQCAGDPNLEMAVNNH